VQRDAIAAVVWSCGPALQAGEDGAVERAARARRRDMSSAPRGAAQRLVGRGRDDVAWPAGEGCAPPAIRPAMCATSAASTAPTPRRSREAREVDRARDRRAAAPDQLRALAQRQLAHLVEVGRPGVAPHAVADGAEPAAGDRDAPAVCQVPAGVERHAEHGVARLEQRGIGGQVRGRAGQRLHVGVVGAEQATARARRRASRPRSITALPW
jgi:hypothetical protein